MVRLFVLIQLGSSCCLAQDALTQRLATARQNIQIIQENSLNKWFEFKATQDVTNPKFFFEAYGVTFVSRDLLYARYKKALVTQNERTKKDIEAIRTPDWIVIRDYARKEDTVIYIERSDSRAAGLVAEVRDVADLVHMFRQRVADYVVGEFAVPKNSPGRGLIVAYDPWKTINPAKQYTEVAKKSFETEFQMIDNHLLPTEVRMFGELDGALNQLGFVRLSYTNSNQLTQLVTEGRATRPSDPVERYEYRFNQIRDPRWVTTSPTMQLSETDRLIHFVDPRKSGVEHADPAVLELINVSSMSNDRILDYRADQKVSVEAAKSIQLDKSQNGPDVVPAENGSDPSRLYQFLPLLIIGLPICVLILWIRIWIRNQKPIR